MDTQTALLRYIDTEKDTTSNFARELIMMHVDFDGICLGCAQNAPCETARWIERWQDERAENADTLMRNLNIEIPRV